MKATVFMMIVGLVSVAFATSVSLQTAYDSCSPGEGYDKLLILDPANTYIGGLTVTEGAKSCLHGNGALIYLNSDGYWYSIRAWGTGTSLDIDHCVIRGGNEGLGLHDSSQGKIVNCTFYNCIYSIYAWDTTTTEAYNNIFSFGTPGAYSFVRLEGAITVIHHDDVWGTPLGNYMEFCPG